MFIQFFNKVMYARPDELHGRGNIHSYFNSYLNVHNKSCNQFVLIASTSHYPLRCLEVVNKVCLALMEKTGSLWLKPSTPDRQERFQMQK